MFEPVEYHQRLVRLPLLETQIGRTKGVYYHGYPALSTANDNIQPQSACTSQSNARLSSATSKSQISFVLDAILISRKMFTDSPKDCISKPVEMLHGNMPLHQAQQHDVLHLYATTSRKGAARKYSDNIRRICDVLVSANHH